MKSVCMVVQGEYEGDIRVRRKAEALVGAGYQVDALALRSPSSANAQFELNGVRVHTLALGKQRGTLARYTFEYAYFFLWTLLKLPALMRRHKYSVVEINTLPDFLVFAAYPARLMRAKILFDMHEITPEFYISKYGISEHSKVIRLLKLIERASMRFSDHVLTINEPINDLLVSRGLDRSRTSVIMNSADQGLFPDASASAEPALRPAVPSAFVFMYHGTLTKIYGLDIAIDAFARAASKMPNAEFWILGDGPERGPLQAQVEGLQLAGKVKFIGKVPPQEVHSWLRRSSAGVLPTRQDVFLDYSFSNKLSEYVIMEKPVIASRLRTIRHYFSETALAYFAPGDAQDLATRMVELHDTKAWRDELVTQARSELHPIRWEIMKARYLRVIDGLVSAGRQVESGV